MTNKQFDQAENEIKEIGVQANIYLDHESSFYMIVRCLLLTARILLLKD